MVHLDQQGKGSALVWRAPAAGSGRLDKDQLPQRPVATQWLTEKPGAERLQTFVGQRRIHRLVTQMVVQTDDLVLHPPRCIQMPGRHHHALAEYPRRLHTRRYMLAQALKGHAAMRRCVEYQDAADMHGGMVVLEMQERGIEIGQLLHGHLHKCEHLFTCADSKADRPDTDLTAVKFVPGE